MATYRDLEVWRLGMDLVCEVYAITSRLPGDERFGLISQLQRAAVSVPANIAEGHARDSTKEFIRFISIAKGSVAEIETLLELVFRLNFLGRDELREAWSRTAQVGRMLTGLKHKLQGKAAAEKQPSREVNTSPSLQSPASQNLPTQITSPKETT